MFICLSLSPIASFPLSCPSATLLTASLPCSHLNSISSASSFFVHHPTITVHNQSDVNNRQILFTLLLSGHVKVNLGPYKQRHQSGLKSGGSWIRVKKNRFFQANLQKISIFLGNFTKNFDFPA